MKIALPAITIGWRARLERRVGTGTRSGSSAARGLRGVILRLLHRRAPDPFECCSGGWLAAIAGRVDAAIAADAGAASLADSAARRIRVDPAGAAAIGVSRGMSAQAASGDAAGIASEFESVRISVTHS